MTQSKPHQFWGNSFTPISAEALSQVPLSSNTREFLQNVGLPANGPTPMSRYYEVSFLPSQAAKLLIEENPYLAVGRAKHIIFTLSDNIVAIEGDTDHVYFFDGHSLPQAPIRHFLNSDIEKLLTCIVLYNEYIEPMAAHARELNSMMKKLLALPVNERDDLRKQISDRGKNFLAEVRDKFAAIDPVAIDLYREPIPFWIEVLFDEISHSSL